MNVRVAIVDDSEIARVAVSRALTGASGITLLGAFESVAALEQSRLMPRAHVILLDVWMPERSGLSAIRELASRARVVVLSDTKEDSSIAKEARAQGASGFFTKASLASDAGREALFDAVRALAGPKVTHEAMPVLVIVGSTGAPRALEKIMPELVGVNAAILVAQHAPAGGEREIARFLTTLGLSASVAAQGATIERGKVLVAPGGQHTRLTSSGVLRMDPAKAKEVSPSADILLESAAWLERRLVAVVLSGMGRDGAKGVVAATGAHAVCLVQDPADCVADSMPRAALAAARSATAVRLFELGAHARTFLTRIR